MITGDTAYVDDIRLPNGRPPALSMMVVRSPHAHALVKNVELQAANATAGVVAVFSGRALVSMYGMPAFLPVHLPGSAAQPVPQRYPLATDRVRYVGEPVAVVLAETPYAARDGHALVAIDYAPLPVVVDPEQAMQPDAPLLYPERASNLLFRIPVGGGDIAAAFARADHTLSLRLENQRLAPSSIEPRGCLFDYDSASGEFTAWVSSQSVFKARDTLAHFLKIPAERIHVHNSDVGGAFGAKTNFVGEEIVAALLAFKYARPVKWIEDRSENLQAQTQGRGQIHYVEAAYTNDGRVLGLRLQIIGDAGAFPQGVGPVLPVSTAYLLNGAYRIEAIACTVMSVLTNKAPTSPYRGAGRPEAAYTVERTIDAVARELKLDPVEVRRRNLIPPDAFPYQAPTGLRYDSGNYQMALDKALVLAEYDTWRARQRERRRDPQANLLGIGVSTFIETTGGRPSGSGSNAPRDAATVRISREGRLEVLSAVAHTGQGHITIFSQIVAAVFNVSGSQVDVYLNDVDLPGFSIGTFGSRTTGSSGVAIHLAAEALRGKVLQLAASRLEAAPTDLEITQGRVTVRGVPARFVELGTLAQMVEEQPDLISHEPPNPANGRPIEGLAAWYSFSPDDPAIASGTHIAVVEVERETGNIQILRYIAVDDGGHILNHMLVEGQVHGSLAQGIGQALFEGIFYDEQGQNLTTTFMNYAMPKAEQLPHFELELVETPTPLNALGAKGVGEAGTIAAPPTIVNAVLDALSPLGIKTLDMPLLPEKIWRVMRSAEQSKSVASK
ncbi:aldehyde dehydrogenase [Ktedonobacteria bacterium brp13]|nr:aldehyde dehydrogenase [Ktedonobacteria bacterium brp13]